MKSFQRFLLFALMAFACLNVVLSEQNNGGVNEVDSEEELQNILYTSVLSQALGIIEGNDFQNNIPSDVVRNEDSYIFNVPKAPPPSPVLKKQTILLIVLFTAHNQFLIMLIQCITILRWCPMTICSMVLQSSTAANFRL
ncbi:hypothetical protein EVAR_72463_1 [Eumeta japonica]|uniref:Uncharacterized protein n=1 Tax=Eumeta variegata TaxID=151549 RepID=A0A4C1SBY8_EUMVA|nr:hypothetical protein EVAR_72463_1 [Eumeta japonica]